MRYFFAALALTLAACGGAADPSDYDDEVAQVLDRAECPRPRQACSQWAEASCEPGARGASCWYAAATCVRTALEEPDCPAGPMDQRAGECVAQQYECFATAADDAERGACIVEGFDCL